VPALVNVADWGVLVLPTCWSEKVRVVVLREKPGLEAGGGTAAVLPPPPQDMEHKAVARQAAARITCFARSYRSALARMTNASSARVLLTPMEVLSYIHLAFRLPRAHLRVPLPCTRVHGTKVLVGEHFLLRWDKKQFQRGKDNQTRGKELGPAFALRSRGRNKRRGSVGCFRHDPAATKPPKAGAKPPLDERLPRQSICP